MDEKWSMDFKKLRKSSSKKLIKGGLGFFLSPRDGDAKESSQEGPSSASKDGQPMMKKSNDWGSDNGMKLDSSSDLEDNERDYIDNIPVIPSIDDFADDDLTNEIAKAPLIGVKQIATYKELENDVLRHSAFANFEEVNLRVLIRLLHQESALNEQDVPWTKDGLFCELVTNVNERKMS